MIKIIECQKAGYPARTIQNIAESDITIAFAKNFNTAGERLTKSTCVKLKRPYFPVTLHHSASWEYGVMVGQQIEMSTIMYPLIINIAGNGIYNLPDWTQEELNNYMKEFLDGLYSICQIELVRSGGQTGIDEAGVIAADRLGIETLVLAPKSFWFRTKTTLYGDGEETFKERFK